MEWWQIDITGEEPEILEGILALHGAEGTLRISPDSIRGFYQTSESNINEILSNLNSYNPKLGKIDDTNWVSKCDELLVPLTIGKLTITPVATFPSSHNNSPNEILIIPGMGFGTGHHETTAMMLGFMQDLTFTPDSVLDYGAGSGILTIAANYLWPKSRVVGIEIDEAAVNNAQENCKLNKINPNCIKLGENPPTEEVFSLIISNLYAEALIERSERLVKACTNTLLLSGILEEKAEEIINAFSALGAKIKRKETQNKWCSMELVLNRTLE